MQSEISLCRVYKRSGIDDGHGQSSSSNQASSGRRISSRTGAPTSRHGSSPSSTPLSPTQLSPTQQLSSFHVLHGECSSASPPAPIIDQVVTVHSAPPPQLLLPHPRPCTYAPAVTIRSTEAVALQRAQGTVAGDSTYSLLNCLNMAASTPMAGSSRPELSTLVGPSLQAYATSLSAATGSHFIPMMPAAPPPMPQMTPLGALPMAPPPPSVVGDKLSWDWNLVPDTTARDYNASGFK